MSKIVISNHLQKDKKNIEIIERKGFGHPDTLSDALAERLSANYSWYTLEKFGVILHHNFDKVGLLGGSSSVKFGDGKMVDPIRVLLNGRASLKFGVEEIPLRKCSLIGLRSL
jgi:S-adenosylmethionine synthetase